MGTSVSRFEGANIVSFLQGHLRQTLGRGECWDAAETAIRAVAARRPNASQLYVWGAVVLPAALQPGDVLQFSSFVSTVTVNGETAVDSTEIQLGTPRHTAIVSSINIDGSVNLLHQNFMDDRFVTTLSNVFLRVVTQGATTVAILGSVTCYRPQIP